MNDTSGSTSVIFCLGQGGTAEQKKVPEQPAPLKVLLVLDWDIRFWKTQRYRKNWKVHDLSSFNRRKGCGSESYGSAVLGSDMGFLWFPDVSWYRASLTLLSSPISHPWVPTGQAAEVEETTSKPLEAAKVKHVKGKCEVNNFWLWYAGVLRSKVLSCMRSSENLYVYVWVTPSWGLQKKHVRYVHIVSPSSVQDDDLSSVQDDESESFWHMFSNFGFYHPISRVQGLKWYTCHFPFDFASFCH